MALRIVIGDVTIGIQGQDFSYIFSVGCGGMESLYKDGKEWLYRTPRPAFWRAVTDNDRGCGFAFRSAVRGGSFCTLQPGRGPDGWRGDCHPAGTGE